MFARAVTREAFTGILQVAAVTALRRRLHVTALVLAAGHGGRSLIIKRHLGLQLHKRIWLL